MRSVVTWAACSTPRPPSMSSSRLPPGHGVTLRSKKERPGHYRSVSITLYSEDVQRLEALLAELKSRGHSRANKSLIVREALRQIDLDLIPPQR
ncbi:MAG: hypothetical protein R3F43_23555 [bacterium]